VPDAIVPGYTPLAWTTPKAEAQRLGLSARTILRACKAGELRCVRLNDRGDVRLTPAWTDAWMLSKAGKESV